jgi:MerR family transcriptional regulator, heat shock protein HspR
MQQNLPNLAPVQLLVNTVMPWAEAQLQEAGRISAAAAWLLRGDAEPKFRAMESAEGLPALSVAEQEKTLAIALRGPWQRDELDAILLAAPVLYGRTGSGERSPAVRLHVEAGEGYCADILMPYRIRNGWRRHGISRNRVHFSHPVAQESDSRFNESPAPRRTKRMPTKRRSKGAYMISAVAEMYEIHPQTLRLYEREGLLKPSRTEGNTRLYTDEDLERLEFILNLARDLGVNISGIAIILQMRERMEEMNRQMQSFVDYVRSEMLQHIQQGSSAANAAMVPLRKAIVMEPTPSRDRKR